MKIIELNNAYEVKDLDIKDDDECRELGRIVADKCVVFLNQPLSEKRLYEIQTQWGTPSRSLIEDYVCEKKLQGSHWRELLASLGHISSDVEEYNDGMTRVSFAKNKKGKPTGLFANGELNWHCDQQAFTRKQRIIGLTSLSGTQNSQTSFLCTGSVYESLNHEDKTMVDELVNIWEWDGGTMSAELIPSQMEIVKYNMIPADGLESPLVEATATGRKGLKFPSHSFKCFKGMSLKESLRIKEYLWSKLDKPENIYTHDWLDGQTIFMDQNITLHARPTNVKDGDKRTMARMVSYLDKLYEGQNLHEGIYWNDRLLSHDKFAIIIDNQRKDEYLKAMSMR